MWITLDLPIDWRAFKVAVNQEYYYMQPSYTAWYFNMKKESAESELIREFVK